MPRLPLALCLIGGLAGAARADALRTAREQPLTEVSHTVDIRLDNGTAIYKVRRQFTNAGKLADEAGLAIDLPYGAAATGLRIKAHTKWYDGELMERGRAAEIYQQLTGIGAYAPKDPALLQWLWADKLYLQVFPVMPGEVSTVEYTLTVPTRYQNGRYYLSYPRTDAAAMSTLVTPILTVHGTAFEIDGRKLADGVPTKLVPPPHDELATDPRASYAISTITVPTSSHTQRAFTAARVTVDIRHTYTSDLQVELVTPAGERLMLFDHKGGGDNNIQTRFDAKLPDGTTGAGAWKLVVSDHVALDSGTIDGWKLELGDTTLAATDTPKFIPDAPEAAGDAGVASIAIEAPRISTWLGRLGRVVASDVHSFARLEVDVAKVLVPLPRRAQVVFVVDASFSGGAELVPAQLAIIKAYLTHVPDAEVEVIAVRRRATRVFGSFLPATDVPKALAANAAAFALGNGSALDEGAALAAKLLADRTGPARVVLASDKLLRTALTPQLALAALDKLPARAIVHVVEPLVDNDDRNDLTRDDSDNLAALASRHHGIFARVSGFPLKKPTGLPPAILELVRPTRIEHVAVTGGLVIDSETLREGTSIRLLAKLEKAPEHVTLTGMIWSDPITKQLDAETGFSRATAAFIFGADEHHELSDAEQMTVAMMGRAVSPVTSYVATEPGTRPSTVGFGEIGTGRYGTIGHGSGSGSGYGMGRVQRPAVDVDPTACLAAHPQARAWHVHLDVETTKDEIVDVTGPSDELAQCLVETAWTVRLDARFYEERATYAVELGAGS